MTEPEALTLASDDDKERIHNFAVQDLRHAGLGHSIISLLQEWELLVLRTVEVCTARFLKRVLKKALIWFLLVLAIGIILHKTRGLYFYVAPHIIKHSTTWTIVINAIMLDFVDTILAIKLITFAVEEALRFLSAGRFPHSMPHLTEMLEPRLLNASSLRQSLKESTVPCADLETGWKTLETWIRSQTNDRVCPILRSVTPLGQAGRMLNYLGQPFSYGSSPQGNNCHEGDYDLSQSSVCMVVNSGLVILQIVLPLMIAVLLVRSYLGVALKTVWLSVKTAVLAVRCAVAMLGVLL